MNTVQNDYGECVVAVGAENSLERLKVKWPRLIKEAEQLAEWSRDGYKDDIISPYFAFEKIVARDKLNIPNWEYDLFEQYFSE